MEKLVPNIRFPGFTDPWKQRKLSQICDYADYRGKTPKKVDYGIPLITAKNIKKGYIDYECSKEFIEETDYENIMRRGYPEIGDVLITTEAPCGNVAQVNNPNIALAQRVIKYRAKDRTINNTFLKWFLLSENFQNRILSLISGGTVGGIKGSILHQQVVSFPRTEEQIAIANLMENFELTITLHQRQALSIDQKENLSMENRFNVKRHYRS